MMPYKKKITFALMAIAAGMGIAWIAKMRGQAVQGLSTWQRVLSKNYGDARAQWLSEQVHYRYKKLLAEKPLPANPILRRHVIENILPGLALYQVLLQEHNNDQQAALVDIDEAFRAWTIEKNRLLMAPLKILPIPFWLIKLAFEEKMKDFPSEGWDFVEIENSNDRFAFNATRCFYLNTLKAYGAPELTASFCKTDDVMAEMFPPSVRFVRPHTIGRGDTICDFEYCLVRQP